MILILTTSNGKELDRIENIQNWPPVLREQMMEQMLHTAEFDSLAWISLNKDDDKVVNPELNGSPTDREIDMYGITTEAIKSSRPAFMSNEIYACCILSDAQELMSYGDPQSLETARQFINKAKYLISHPNA